MTTNQDSRAEIQTALDVTEACGRLLHPHSGWATFLKPHLEQQRLRLIEAVLEDDSLSPEDREVRRQKARLLKEILAYPQSANDSCKELLRRNRGEE